MPYALTFAGLLLIITGINNTYSQLGAQLKKDFSGDKSFLMYIAALGGVGALGYIPTLRRFSHLFMALILISLVLSNKGFFNNLSAALKGPLIAPVANNDASAPQVSSAEVAKGLATGDNPGSDMLGTFTYKNITKPFLDFTKKLFTNPN